MCVFLGGKTPTGIRLSLGRCQCKHFTEFLNGLRVNAEGGDGERVARFFGKA